MRSVLRLARAADYRYFLGRNVKRFFTIVLVAAGCGGGAKAPAVDVDCAAAPAGSQTFQCTMRVRDGAAVDYEVWAGTERVAHGTTDKVAVSRLEHAALLDVQRLRFTFVRGGRRTEREVEVPRGLWYEVLAREATGVPVPRITVLTAPANQVRIDGKPVPGDRGRFTAELPLLADAQVDQLPTIWRTVTVEISAPGGERTSVTQEVNASGTKMFATPERGLPWMAAYRKAAGPRPTLIVLRDAKPPYAAAGGLKRVGDAELIAVAEQERVSVGDCPGPGFCPPDKVIDLPEGGQRCAVPAGKLLRLRLRSRVVLREARTGAEIDERTFEGPVPACPKQFDFVAGKTPVVEGPLPLAAISAWVIRAR
jgi:hypothetical protein